MDNERPNYYAVIPADVRYDKELKANEKLLYGEISALTQKEGVCWASNNYFAKLYDVYPTTISKWIKHLAEKGYITIKLVYNNETKEIEKRIIGIAQNDNTYCSKEQEGIVQMSNRGIAQKSKDNNTSINNININKREMLERKTQVRDTKPSLEEIIVYVKDTHLEVNPKKFFDYYEAGNWKDRKDGKPINWKQKIMTWDQYEKRSQPIDEKTKEEQEEAEKWKRFMERHKDCE